MPIPMSQPTTTTTSSPSRPKVLIPEKVSADGLALLEGSLEVHQRKGLSPDDLLSIIGDYDALIVRSETKVTASLLSAGKNLKVVARAGVGVDNVDVSAATKLGIVVVNSPTGNINSAAEHTIALLMAVARNVGDACASLKAGRWERSRLVGVEVKGKVLGIVGLGKVGLTVARQAGGLGMSLIAYDPYANPSLAAAANVTLVPSLAEILTECDFLTLHTPLIASTKGMIGEAELASMKPTARILNVARGGMIDEVALVEALEKGAIAGAGLDVFTSEPPLPDSSASRLIAHPKVVATPHLGASTVEAQENVSIDVCQQVLSILSGQLPRSAVNAPIILPEEYRTLAPFVSLVEKMGSLYTQHWTLSNTSARKKEPFTYRTTYDLILSGTLAKVNTTKPLFAALVKGLLSPILSPEDSNINIVNAELIAKERGILINEQRDRGDPDKITGGYSASVTLRARVSRSSSTSRPAVSRQPSALVQEQPKKSGEETYVITGFVSHNTPYISRLGKFATNFIPTGNLMICRNYDSPGKIGVVGEKLGRAGVNINFMSVAPALEDEEESEEAERKRLSDLERRDSMLTSNSNGNGLKGTTTEALMILGVDRHVENEVVQGLLGDEGVLEASVVVL